MKSEEERVTRKLKPVTEAKEVAMEAPERESWPRWPTNMTDISWRQDCNRLTVTRGPASHSCVFASSATLLLSDGSSIKGASKEERLFSILTLARSLAETHAHTDGFGVFLYIYIYNIF